MDRRRDSELISNKEGSGGFTPDYLEKIKQDMKKQNI